VPFNDASLTRRYDIFIIFPFRGIIRFPLAASTVTGCTFAYFIALSRTSRASPAPANLRASDRSFRGGSEKAFRADDETLFRAIRFAARRMWKSKSEFQISERSPPPSYCSSLSRAPPTVTSASCRAPFRGFLRACRAFRASLSPLQRAARAERDAGSDATRAIARHARRRHVCG